MLKMHKLMWMAGTFLSAPAFVLKATTPEFRERIAGGTAA